MRRIVEQADPRRIGIDVSESFALADGLSHTEHRLLTEALGPVRRAARAGRGPRRRLAGDPAARRRSGRCTPSTGWCTRSSTRPTPPPSSPSGRRRRSTSPGGSGSASTTSGSSRGSSRRVGLQRAGVPLVEERGTLLPAVPYDAVIEPGDLVHCDVGLASLGLRTDTQRNGYVLRPGETAAPAGLREALRVGNRMQDLTTGGARRRPDRQRGARRGPRRPRPPRASTPTSTPTRSASTATAPARRSASGTSRTASAGPATTPSTPTPSTRWSSRCAGRCRSGAGSACGWRWSRASP